MKLITLLSAFVILTYTGQAQSFNFVSPTTHIHTTNVSSIAQGFLTVHNSASSPRDVMIERMVNDLAPGHTSYFCWDVCYSDTVNFSTGFLTIPAGADNFSFYCDVDPHGVSGLDTLRYRFFDPNNPTDQVDIYLYFDIGSTGIANVNAQNGPLSSASPNPANSMTGFNYSTDMTKNPKLVIYDLLGSKVFETNLVQKQGAYLLNVSDFNQGIYMYSLIENGKPVATKKLVVSHK